MNRPTLRACVLYLVLTLTAHLSLGAFNPAPTDGELEAVVDLLQEDHLMKRLNFTAARVGEVSAQGENWCIGGSGITMCGSLRVAGAIDYLAWNNMQFINAVDHGRELQFAISNEHGECYNPTEAGSSNDGEGPSSSSHLLGANTIGNVYRTTSLPAFWIAPGQYDPNGKCTGVNPTVVSSFVSSKSVTIGAYGQWNAIQYLFSSYVPQPQSFIQFEAPTGYMPLNFNTFFLINLDSGQLTPTSASPAGGETPQPVVISTPDGRYAMSAYLAGAPQAYASYARFYFPYASGAAKWSIVYRQSGAGVGTLGFHSIVCVGSLSDVQQCMVNVARKTGYVH